MHEAQLGPEVEIVGDGLLATYIVHPEAEIELLSIPRHMDATLGYAPPLPFTFTMQDSR